MAVREVFAEHSMGRSLSTFAGFLSLTTRTHSSCWRATATLLLAVIATPVLAASPDTPRAYVDTSMPSVTGPTIRVAAGGNLQTALDNATCGNTVALAPGASFVGNFVIRKKPCTGWIIVTTDLSPSSLPVPGTRMTPAAAANLAKIVTPNVSPAIDTVGNTSHYRFIGVQVTELSNYSDYQVDGAPAYTNYGLVRLGVGDEKPATNTPEYIVFDRTYIWARARTHAKRGITLNGRNLAVIDSYIEGMKGVGQDTQAILSTNGAGPFKIVNNYLEGAGENVMFGGADPAIPNLVPSDIEFRGNYVAKPLGWQSRFTYTDSGGSRQDQWSVKNLFETKNVRRLLMEGNIFENCWAHAQIFALIFKPSNQDGGCTWCTSQDILFRHNIISNVAGGINIASSVGNDTPMARARFYNNLLYRVGDPARGNAPTLQLVGSAALDSLTFENNTIIRSQEDGNLFTLEVGQSPGFVFANNVTSMGSYGIKASGLASGNASLAYSFSVPYVFTGNVIARDQQGTYPAGNYFPQSLSAIGFVNEGSYNYALSGSSPYKNKGSDGKDPGADVAVLNTYTAGARTGVWPSGLPPLPPVSGDSVAPNAPTNFTAGSR